MFFDYFPYQYQSIVKNTIAQLETWPFMYPKLVVIYVHCTVLDDCLGLFSNWKKAYFFQSLSGNVIYIFVASLSQFYYWG